MSVYVNGREVFNNSDINNPDIDGGTIDNAAIASGTLDGALLGATKTNIQKGPAIINSGFAGTVTAAASTTVTFSSDADAILAGYNATNPILGTTLTSNALTRYIVRWTDSTTCVVDSSVTWAGTAITSVQYPIATFVNSAGVTTGWMLASGVMYIPGDVGIGTTSPGYPLNVKGASGSIARFEHNGSIGTIDIYSGTTGGLINIRESTGTAVINLDARGTNTRLLINGGDDLNTNFAAKINGLTKTGLAVTNSGNVGIGTTSPTSTIHGAGSFALPITTKTADYTAGASDYTILVSCSSVNITITLPAASGCSGRIYNIKKIDATGYTVTVDGNSSETIDGALTQVISTQYESLQIQSSGSVWYIL